jgi:hypothetical protein
MKFTAVTLLLTANPLTVTAAWKLLVNKTTYPPNFSASLAGAFDLRLVYPLYSGTNAAASATICSNSSINFHKGYYTFSGTGLPVNVIYYGSGFTDTQHWLIQNFLGNIGGTSYWNIVKAYINDGWAAATPTYGSMWSTSCIESRGYGLNGSCQVIQFKEHRILNYGIDKGKLANQRWSIYAILLGTDVRYTTSDGQFVMGASALCGTHGISSWGSSKNYAYITAQIPTSYSSECNMAKDLGGVFPNEYAVDNLVAIVLHELIETIISSPLNWSDAGQIANGGRGSAFRDVCGNEPSDKCNNMYLSVGKYSNNGNIQVGNANYLVFPVYDMNTKVCSMAPGSIAITTSTGGSQAVLRSNFLIS